MISRSRMGREGSRQAYPQSGVRPPRSYRRSTNDRKVVGREGAAAPAGVPDSSCSWAGERGGRRTGRPRGERWALAAGGSEGGDGQMATAHRWVEVPKERACGLWPVAVWACWCCPSEEHKFAISPRLKVVPFKCYFKFGFG